MESFLTSNDIQKISNFIRRSPIFIYSSLAALDDLLEKWPIPKEDEILVNKLAKDLFNDDEYHRIANAIIEIIKGDYSGDLAKQSITFTKFFMKFYIRYGNEGFFRSLIGKDLPTFDNGFSIDEKLNSASYRLLKSDGYEWMFFPDDTPFEFIFLKKAFSSLGERPLIMKFKFCLFRQKGEQDAFYYQENGMKTPPSISELVKIAKCDVMKGLPPIKCCPVEAFPFPSDDCHDEYD